jgi:hypothetical protein
MRHRAFESACEEMQRPSRFFASRDFPGLSEWWGKNRSVVTVSGYSQYTVKNKRADTGSKEPAILRCLVRVTRVLAWEATPRTVCVTRVSCVCGCVPCSSSSS